MTLSPGQSGCACARVRAGAVCPAVVTHADTSSESIGVMRRSRVTWCILSPSFLREFFEQRARSLLNQRREDVLAVLLRLRLLALREARRGGARREELILEAQLVVRLDA